MNAGVRLRFGNFLISLAGRKGFTNDAPDWGAFALVSYQMNVGTPFGAKAAGGPGTGGAGAPGAGGAGAGGPGAGGAGAPGAGGAGAGGPGAGAPGAGGPGAGGPGAGGPGAGGPGAGAVAGLPPSALPPSLRSALRDVNFQFDQYGLTDDAKATLDELGQALKANPQFAVTIEGHADERGTVEYNIALGEQRAQAAKAYLVALGVDASRVDTISHGEQQPVDAGHDELAWAINRRAHFLVRTR
jgi:peptidoglycan-associated lipoprotein